MLFNWIPISHLKSVLYIQIIIKIFCSTFRWTLTRNLNNAIALCESTSHNLNMGSHVRTDSEKQKIWKLQLINNEYNLFQITCFKSSYLEKILVDMESKAGFQVRSKVGLINLSTLQWVHGLNIHRKVFSWFDFNVNEM